MSDQVLMLRRDHPLDFVADETYAEMLRAYFNLLRPALVGDPGCATQVKVVDHLIERLGQARACEISIPLLDIADRLHAELVRQPLPV